MAIFGENFKNHIKGEFVKIKEVTLVIILWLSFKNVKTGLKMKILKFLGIQAKCIFHYIDQK